MTAEHSKKPPRVIKCPQCGKESIYTPENATRPFCSDRCRILDLGQWAAESYRIATRESGMLSERDGSEEEKN